MFESKVRPADDAIQVIQDGDVVYLGGNGAINVPDFTIAALARR